MSITTITSAGLSVNDIFTPDPQAKGRNGDDRVWEACHRALMAQQWGLALEMVQTLNAFFQAHAVDELVNAADLRRWNMSCDRPALAARLAAEVDAWNRACRRRWGL